MGDSWEVLGKIALFFNKTIKVRGVCIAHAAKAWVTKAQKDWIPAFAGMTKWKAGIVNRKTEMANGLAIQYKVIIFLLETQHGIESLVTAEEKAAWHMEMGCGNSMFRVWCPRI